MRRYLQIYRTRWGSTLRCAILLLLAKPSFLLFTKATLAFVSRHKPAHSTYWEVCNFFHPECPIHGTVCNPKNLRGVVGNAPLRKGPLRRLTRCPASVLDPFLLPNSEPSMHNSLWRMLLLNLLKGIQNRSRQHEPRPSQSHLETWPCPLILEFICLCSTLIQNPHFNLVEKQSLP